MGWDEYIVHTGERRNKYKIAIKKYLINGKRGGNYCAKKKNSIAAYCSFYEQNLVLNYSVLYGCFLML